MEITKSSYGLFMGKIGGISSKKCLQSYMILGDYKIEYCDADKTYIIERKDGKVFDGSENSGAIFMGTIKPPKTMDEKVEHIINSSISFFTRNLSIDENYNSMFIEFDYRINDENNQIKVFPVYLEDFTNYTIKLDTALDKELGEIGLCFEPERKCRNLNEYEKLCLDTLEKTCNKYNIIPNYNAGLYKEGCLCISKVNNIWKVYVARDGNSINEIEFNNCSDACIGIIELISDSIIQRIDAADYFLYMIELNHFKSLSEEKLAPLDNTVEKSNQKVRKRTPNDK